jgi:hypothetical protein
MFAKIQNNTVVEWPIPSIYARFPNTSFPVPLTQADMPNGYVIVDAAPTPQSGLNQKIIPAAPVQQGDKWVQRWNVVSMTLEEIQEHTEAHSTQVRAERNARIAASDWTQIADAKVDQVAWAKYRQALREVTRQVGFPWSVQWPTQP